MPGQARRSRISGGQISGAYVHGDDIICNSLQGTFDDLSHDGAGYVTVDIGPPSSAPFNGNWLDANQPFCTFAVNLSTDVRLTNGYLGSYPCRLRNGAILPWHPAIAIGRAFYWLALAILALWRVTHLLNAEDGPWGAVAWLRGRAGDRFWGQLLDCFYCLSLWLAVPFAFLVGEGVEGMVSAVARAFGGQHSTGAMVCGRAIRLVCGGPARWLVAGRCGSSFRTGCGSNRPGWDLRLKSVSPQRRGFLAQAPLYFEYLGDTGLTAVGPITGRRYRFNGPGARVAVGSSRTHRRCAPSPTSERLLSPDRSSLDPGRRYVAEGRACSLRYSGSLPIAASPNLPRHRNCLQIR